LALRRWQRETIYSIPLSDVYAFYGFQQIETPAMETLHTLMGKYGDEGDKLLFKVLNSGDYLKDVS
jgi:histidyl-tRNA synthetase